jgi:hypothetical protein
MVSIPDDKCSGYGLIDLLKPKNQKITGIEIGSDKGNTTSFLLKTLQNLFIYCVDPYENYIDWNSNQLYERESTFQNFINRMTDYSDRYKLYRNKSDDAFKFFEKKSVDFIFIDGLHTYEQVKNDCQNYYSILKDGGIFSGHDYNTILEVKNAVNEFAKSVNKKQIFLTDFDVWYFYK